MIRLFLLIGAIFPTKFHNGDSEHIQSIDQSVSLFQTQMAHRKNTMLLKRRRKQKGRLTLQRGWCSAC